MRIPSLADANTVELRVQATDTGGNIGLSEPLQIEIVPDTVRPTIISINPQDGAVRGKGFTSVLIEFSEPMDSTKISAATIGMALNIGMALPIEPVSITPRSFATTFQFVYPPFEPGDYHMSLFASVITDVAGNPLGDSLFVSTFEVAEATAVFVTSEGGDWNTGSNWDSGTVPDADDDVLLDLPAGAEVTFSSGESTIRNLTGKTPVTVTGGILEVTDSIRLDAALTLDGGAIKGATILPGADGQCLEVTPDRANLLIGVTLGCDIVLDQTGASFRVDEGITLNSATITLEANISKIGFVGDETIEGNGRIFFSPFLTNYLEMAEAGTLTIGSGIIIEGSRGYIGGLNGWGVDCNVINNGLIRATWNIGELFIETRGGHFTSGPTGRLVALFVLRR
ncbi:MAG: hypothetical protein ACI9R3_001158 [Verrucomicrobiales bacterium]